MRLLKTVAPLRISVPAPAPSILRVVAHPPRPADHVQPQQSRAQPTPPKGPRPLVRASSHQKLIQSLRRLIVNRQHVYASDVFHQVMQVRFHTRERSLVFAHATDLFINHGHIKEAMQIYSFMTLEGLIPATKLRATMYVARRVAMESIPSVESVVAASEIAVKDKAFDFECLQYLIRALFQVYIIPIEALEHIVQAYIKAHPPAHGVAEKMQDFMNHLRGRRERGSRKQPEDILAALNGKELARLAKAGPKASRQVATLAKRILQTPGQKHGRNSLSRRALLNTLAALYVRRGQYEDGFTLYRYITQEIPRGPTPQLLSLLIRVVARLCKPRPLGSVVSKRPAYIPSLRELFHDVMVCHLRQARNRPQRPTGMLNATILNKTIRFFIQCHDYAGAYTALWVMRDCGLPVTLDTYKSILSPLVDRLDAEIPRIRRDDSPEQWWTLRFLGFPDHSKLKITVDLVEAIRAVGEEPTTDLYPLAWTAEQRAARFAQLRAARQKQYFIPPTTHLLGITGPGRKTYSEWPLLRILRRAVLAIARRVFVSPAKFVDMTVQDAKREMLPPALRQRSTERRELRFGGYAHSSPA